MTEKNGNCPDSKMEEFDAEVVVQPNMEVGAISSEVLSIAQIEEYVSVVMTLRE